MFETLMVVVGLGVRLLVPFLVTAALVAWLKWLDNRWQQENPSGPIFTQPARPCWEVRACAPAQRRNCPAYLQPNIPCWQCFRDKRGYLRAQCLRCAVFTQAPVAAPNPRQ